MTRRGCFVLAVGAIALLAACGLVGGDEPGSGTSDPLDAELVTLGQPIYAASCATCHGASGEGASDWRTRGPDGALPPPPHDASGHTWHHADGLLYRIVRDGCAAYPAGSTPCGMPAFGEQLDDRDIRAVIEFMRSWWGPQERAFQEEVTGRDPFP